MQLTVTELVLFFNLTVKLLGVMTAEIGTKQWIQKWSL